MKKEAPRHNIFQPVIRVHTTWWMIFFISLFGLAACAESNDTPSHPNNSSTVTPSGSASMEDIQKHEQSHPATTPAQPRDIPNMPAPENDMGSLPSNKK